MRLVFLGTGSQYPSKHRGASSVALRHNNGDIWIFDCGEGTQIQLQRSNLRMSKITKIFITHLHGDHLFGLPGLLCSIGSWSVEKRDSLELYGPLGLKLYIETNLSLSWSRIEYKIIIYELDLIKEQYPKDCQDWASISSKPTTTLPNEIYGQTIRADFSGIWKVCEDDRFIVVASWIEHTIPCFGYVIHEKDLPGKLNANKLMEMGIKPGPLYGRIKRGESVRSSDGRLIMPSEVVGPLQPGRKITILGDNCNSSSMMRIALNSDVLIHEATVENALQDHALKHGHSTPEMAANFAKQINAKALILTHFSQRYSSIACAEEKSKDPDKKSVNVLLEEAKKFASDECVVLAADDFFEFIVLHDDHLE